MKNNALDGLKEAKKKVDLRGGKHLCLILIWAVVYCIVWFQPESTLRIWVLSVSLASIFYRFWLHGCCSGISGVLNGMIESFTSKESSTNPLTATLQEIGNAGIKVKIENKKEEHE